MFLNGFGDDAYGDGWYFYENFGWWNVWFYDHPLDFSRMKRVYLNGMVQKVEPSLPSYIEIAVNWSTPNNPPGGPPPIPPLPPDQEHLLIGRATVFEMQDYVGPIEQLFFEILEYNPEWVSVDVRGFNFVFDGVIEHVCLLRDPQPQSLDLSFCITGGLPQTGACCFPDGTCSDITEIDCNAQGGVFVGAGTQCLGDNDGNGVDDACEEAPAIPTLSQWGILLLALLLLSAVTVAMVRKRKEITA